MSVSSSFNNAYALEAQGIGRRFGGFWAVSDVTLAVKQGERRAILGPNGAGKTTLFNVLTGDVSSSSGTIKMNGLDVTKSSVQKRIGLGMRRTYQHALLFNGLSVGETLFLAVCGVSGGWKNILPLRRSNERVGRAEKLAAMCGLENEFDTVVEELSHGQRRQLEVGMALAENPKILLLDEPAAGLSPAERPHLAELLRSLPEDVTVVLIEHDMEIALQTSDSVSVLHNGKLLAEGTPEAVMQDPLVHEVYVGGINEH